MKDDVSVGEMKRRQQLLRDQIAENDRLIGETAQRVASSRAITRAPEPAPEEAVEKLELPAVPNIGAR